MGLELIAEGSADDFSPLWRRTELRTRLAIGIGVSVEKITLSVVPASVLLRFSVLVEAEALATMAAKLEDALPSANAASDMLGVVVLTTPLVKLEGHRPHRDPTNPSLNESATNIESGSGNDSSLALILVGAGALLLAALVLLVAAFLFRSAKR